MGVGTLDDVGVTVFGFHAVCDVTFDAWPPPQLGDQGYVGEGQ